MVCNEGADVVSTEEAVVQNKFGLFQSVGFETLDRIEHRHDVQNVPGLQIHHDGKLIGEREERQQLERVQAISVLVVALASHRLQPVCIGRDGSGVEGHHLLIRAANSRQTLKQTLFTG